MARMQNANPYVRRAFFNNISQTIDEVVEHYSSGSTSERKALLKQARNSADTMWRSGDWPSALGLGISCLNAESRFVPGNDAAYVRAQTDQLIKEAETAFSNLSGD
jgi:hypothetical protein